MAAKKPTKPRPVVRVVIEVYPHEASDGIMNQIRQEARHSAAWLSWASSGDYRRPRVVSVKAVRGGK